MQQALFWIAAGLAALTLAVHVIAGEMRVMRPMLGSDLPKQLKGFLYLGWHSASIAIIAIAICFVAAALDPEHKALALLATGSAASLVATAIFSAMKLKLPPTQFPVIPLFGLAAAAGIAGLVF